MRRRNPRKIKRLKEDTSKDPKYLKEEKQEEDEEDLDLAKEVVPNKPLMSSAIPPPLSLKKSKTVSFVDVVKKGYHQSFLSQEALVK